MNRPRSLDDWYGPKAARALTDMIEFGGLAADLTARGKSAYDADVQLRLAGEAILQKLGEAAARLPDVLVADHHHIPFRTVRAMRNLIAHDYHRIDHDIVWVTLSRDVPVLAAQIAVLLEQ